MCRRGCDPPAGPAGVVPLECVVNVSEVRDEAVLSQLAAAAGPALLDQHRDPDHNRTVFTLAGPVDLVADASRALARAALAALDLRRHAGAHPRLGVLDVVPFVPYEPGRPAPTDLTEAGAPRAPLPAHGPPSLAPRSGATAVGARRVLLAYNVWVSSVEVARRVAPLVRGPAVR